MNPPANLIAMLARCRTLAQKLVMLKYAMEQLQADWEALGIDGAIFNFGANTVIPDGTAFGQVTGLDLQTFVETFIPQLQTDINVTQYANGAGAGAEGTMLPMLVQIESGPPF